MEIDLGGSNKLNKAINIIDSEPTTSGTNNDINGEIDTSVSGELDRAINNTDTKPSTHAINNDIDMEVNTSILGKTINKIDIELNMNRLDGADTIEKKELKVYKSNLI